MKTSRSVLVAAALAVGTAAPAVGGVLDPEVIIYRFAGVRDSGSADNAGVATVFHCTNFSNDIQNIRFVTRQSNGNLLQNTFSSVAIFGSVTLSTHRTAAYDENDSLQTGPVNQGTTAIAATSINVICTAMTIDASTAVPVGVALRAVRFNPVPGSQE